MAFNNSYESNFDMENIEMTVEEGDDLLIDMVQSRRWLYDKSSSDYADQLKRYNAWKDIGVVFNDTAENCEKRWKRLYQNYSKEKLLRVKESKSGSPCTNRRSWSLFNRMHALFKKTQQANRTYTNVPSASGNSKNSANYPCGKKYSRLKRKTNTLESVLINNVNATTHLLHGAIQKPQASAVETQSEDADVIFGKLIQFELDSLEADKAKTKRKKLLQYLTNIE